MFNKIDDYKKITIVTYPGGNVIHPARCSFDFDKGVREVEKYHKESEKFKKRSVESQSDTSETETLEDSTLDITIQVDDYSFTLVSAAGFPNIAFAKAIAQMTAEQLDKVQAHYEDRRAEDFPKMVEFQEWIAEICGTEGVLDIAFKAVVALHDSYTEEHKNAIKYIVHSLASDYKDEGNQLVITSDDPDLKNAIIDLGMSTYFDITIEE